MVHQTQSGADRHPRAVGVFSNYRAIAKALYELRDAGFPMEQISVITRDFVHQSAIALSDPPPSSPPATTPATNTREGVTPGAISGSTLGGLTGLLTGLESLTIPGIGPLAMAGATATALAATAAGGTVGGLTGAFMGMGIPEQRASRYHERIARGHYLIIIEGTPQEMALADPILRHHAIEEYGVYGVSRETAAPSAPRDEASTLALGRNKYVMGRFPNRPTAEAAIANLRAGNFPIHQISLIARQVEYPTSVGQVEVRDRFDAAPLGMPVDHARHYNDRLDQGDYLILIQGTEAEATWATTILRGHHVQDWHLYDPTLIAAHPTEPASAPHPFVLNHDRADREEPVVRPTRQAIATFSHRPEVEQAIVLLTQAGFPLGRMFLMNPYFEQRGQLTGLHLRNRFDAIRLGIPAERAEYYNRRFNQGAYILLIRGTADEIRRVMEVLQHHPAQGWQDHEPTPVRVTPSRRKAATAPHRARASDRPSTRGRTMAQPPEVIVIDRRHERR